jgi:multiple sugar transport system ATP-binding protein
MTMGDRVAVLRAGVLQQVDHPHVLYDRPDNLFVAAFIGSPAMNLYEASVTADGTSVRIGSQELPLSAGCLTAHSGEGVARVDPTTGVTAGEPITFAVNASGLQFFDPDTEQAIWT